MVIKFASASSFGDYVTLLSGDFGDPGIGVSSFSSLSRLIMLEFWPVPVSGGDTVGDIFIFRCFIYSSKVLSFCMSILAD